jgi:L-lysine 2,3-aminomutase
MYHNRVIMVLNMSCPVYCRFCFRKHKECRQEPPPTRRDVVRGVEYVRASPGITEVVLTGGDPFMNRATLSCAVEGLLEVPQVQVLRLATRSVSYHPALFTERDGFWMEYLKNARQEADRRGKRIEIATHFIHPDELSVRSLDLIAELVSSGIPVYVQTPLLGKVNDRGPELVELYQRLRAAGAEMHYVFMPCSPLQGNRAYRSTVDDGMRLAAYLRGHLPDRAMPRFCTATAFGKIDWGPTGWVVEEDPDDPRYLWLRTPYTEQTFAKFAPGVDLGGVARQNAEGTLDAHFMVDLGDRRWLRGPRARATDGSSKEECAHVDVQDRISAYAAIENAGALAGDEVVRRVHSTRAELDIARAQDDLTAAIDGLRIWSQVSNVVVFSSEVDPLLEPARLRRTIDCLSTLPHVTAVRIRSRQAVVAPSGIRRRALDVLAQGNRLGAVAPVRVELELRILHHSELTTAHRHLAGLLRAHGVSVYATTPMLAGVNDGADHILALSSRCRLYGIDFHHLVVAGEPAQRIWNKDRPISTSLIIDIASELRRCGSGRELPRYVIQTAVGEVDLGLTSEVVGIDGGGSTRLRLLPFVVSDECVVEPWGELPDPIEADPDGHPIVTVPGLTL